MEDILFSLPVLYQSNFSNVNPRTSHVSTESMGLKTRMSILPIYINLNTIQIQL